MTTIKTGSKVEIIFLKNMDPRACATVSSIFSINDHYADSHPTCVRLSNGQQYWINEQGYNADETVRIVPGALIEYEVQRTVIQQDYIRVMASSREEAIKLAYDQFEDPAIDFNCYSYSAIETK